MADAPIGQRALCLAEQVVLHNDVGPPGLVQRMDEVKIDVAGLELCELLIQESVEIRRLLHHPRGQLSRQPHLFAIPILERPANHELALAIVIRVCGVDVIHAFVDGAPQHADRFRFVDVRAAALAIC